MTDRLVIGLNAVLSALDAATPHVLCVKRQDGWGLPFGSFDPVRHRTFEIGMRDFVERQTAVPLGYVEQLYTFGDQGREAPRAQMKDSDPSDRIVSVGYLGLSPTVTASHRDDSDWHDWYQYFPWEDWREGTPESLDTHILPALSKWAEKNGALARLRATFGTDGADWDEARSLERFELMYEAGLVEEAHRDRANASGPGAIPGTGQPMISDHRRILATAIGRLRGKLRYRPIIFQMIPDLFTLTDLQCAVEAILGFEVHKQNFRRSLESLGLVEKTAETLAQTGGRPAALYQPSPLAQEKFAPGLTLPRLRRS